MVVKQHKGDIVRVTVVPDGTYQLRGNPSLFACSLQSICRVFSWIAVMKKYLISTGKLSLSCFFNRRAKPQEATILFWFWNTLAQKGSETPEERSE